MPDKHREQLSKTMHIEIKPNPRDSWQPKMHTESPKQIQKGARKKIIMRSKRHQTAKSTPPTMMRAENSELQELFQNTYDAAFITDFSGQINMANVRATDFFGYTREEMRNANITQLVVGFSDEILVSIKNNLNVGRFTLLEAECVRADNSRFQAEISTSLLQLTNSECLCFFLRDITKRYETEVSLQTANENLKKEIDERHKAEQMLQAAITRLKEHDKAQTQFVSNVSHELKTPLASINYMAGNLLNGVLGPPPESFVPYLQMIREDCSRLSQTVEDILDMTRSEAGSLKLRHVPVSYGRFIRKAITPLNIQAEAAQLTLQMSIDPDLGFVACDPRKLERVLTNIVKNAIKFNREDGSVHVQTCVCDDDESKSWACVCVDDTGIGIAQEHLPHITKRFYRVGEYVSGSGLGLYISNELVERQGGCLHIESPPPGKSVGTRVSVYLPLISAPTVLLIQKDPTVGSIISDTLHNEGYDIRTVWADEDFNAVLDSTQPDLLLIDWCAPDMSGAAIIAAIKQSSHLEKTPTLVFTGSDENTAKNEILRGFAIPTLAGSLTEQTIINRLDKIMADAQA